MLDNQTVDRANNSALQTAAAAFVVLFAFVHLLDAFQRKEICEKGYFATLTVFTLLLTAYVAVVRSPPAVVAAVLSANVIVCALYYGVVNQSYVGGTSFLLHGGCALLLATFIWGGQLDCRANPLSAAFICAFLLATNAFFQIKHEKASKQVLYPSCDNFGNPLWRIIAIPLVGGCVAACIAWTARKMPL